MSTQKPTPLAVREAGIPDALKAELRWVVWRYVPKEEVGKPSRWTKPLFIATAPNSPAKSTDPETWRSFPAALEAYNAGACDGIGFALGDGWVGVDIDPGGTPDVLNGLHTYTERSPSGRGWHAIARGAKPGKRARVGPYEFYSHARYLTVTGHRLETAPMTVDPPQAELDEVYATIFPGPEPSVADARTDSAEPRTGALSDEALLAKIRASAQAAKFEALWRGGHDGYPSASEADLALCALLAWWTRDAARIDRLFRQSGRLRPKWNRVGARTIATAIAGTTGGYAEHKVYDTAIEPEAIADEASPTVVPAYVFTPAFGAEHFVTRWIDNFSRQCDAALEFHEATALVTLAQATSSLSAKISGSAEGLSTNLYVLLVGTAGRSRKSTAMSYGVEAIRRALPESILPEQMTQESFVESLTKSNNGPALWAIDEFTDTLAKIVNSTYLAGMRGLLLEMYARRNYTYRRVSKGAKKSQDGADAARSEDAFVVNNVGLSVIGCATPTIFTQVDNTAVGSGLLTRFAIVMPDSKPPRRPQFELPEAPIPSTLVIELRNISERMANRPVTWAADVLAHLDDAVDRPLDESDDRGEMTARAGVMARKVAMLAAAGRPQEFALVDQPLIVTRQDADAAVQVVTRWIGYARAFEARTEETAFEANVQRCVAIVKGRTVNRRVIGQRLKLPAKVVLEIEATLVQREQIEATERRPQKHGAGRPSWEWKWRG